MNFPYIQELQATLKKQEIELWSELIENSNKPMFDIYPELQISMQSIKEIDSFEKLKVVASHQNKASKEETSKILTKLFLNTPTLSN